MADSNEGQVPEIASRCSVFAKTDLIHAQQEGHSAEAICDGLCKGLARNLADTLFHDFKSDGEVLFTGGVSRNQVVVRYLEELLGARILTHPLSHLFGALGAGLCVLDGGGETITIGDLTEHYAKPVNNREYFYPPLRSASKSYPDFGEAEFHILKPGIRGFPGELQVEIFEDPGQLQPNGVYIGIDIGSDENIPLIGYYTYTSGKPIEAVFSILKAFDHYRKKFEWDPEILGVGIKERINAKSLEKHLKTFNVTPYQSGESYENLLKIFHILEYHPDLSLFVQTNPAFCCPALITEAMTTRIKSITGVPVVTVTYDGTSESKNDIILPYLLAATERGKFSKTH